MYLPLLSVTVPANVFSPDCASFCGRWLLFAAGTHSFANAGGSIATSAAPGTAVSNIVKRNLERNGFMMHLEVKLLDKGKEQSICHREGKKNSPTFYQVEGGCLTGAEK